MNISYTKVIHFLTIVKHMNMNAAAKELFISQSALSLSISRMEEDLGCPLFYRDKNKLILSREAEQLLLHFERIREEYDNLIKTAYALRHSHNNYVNISFSGSLYFFSVLYSHNFATASNTTAAKLSYVDASQAMEMLLSGAIDFSISTFPLIHPLISCMDVFAEPIGFVVPASHPYANRTQISLEELKSQRIHGLSQQHVFRQICDKICSEHHIDLQYETEDDYNNYHKRIFRKNNSHGFFATRNNYEANFRSRADYVYLEFSETDMQRKTGIYYLENQRKQYEHSELLEHLKKTLISYQNQLHLVGNAMSHATQNVSPEPEI